MTAMHKLSSALAGAGLAFLQVVSLPAQAAAPVQLAVQILDPAGACASWTTGGTVLAPTITCNPAAPATPGAPVCSITANNFNPLTLSAAGSVTLSATCTNTNSSTQWSWTGIGASPVTGTGDSPQSLAPTTVSGTTTFGVTATNATGPSANASVTVTVSTTPPPSGGNLFPANGCPGFTKTLTQAFEWSAAGNMRIDTGNLGGMGSNGALVATFVTPATQGPDATLTVGVAEYPPGSTSNRFVTLSTSACDFNPSNLSSGNWASTQNISYALGPSSWGLPQLAPSTRYYVNISNTRNGANACTFNSCDLRLEIRKPLGF